MQLLSFRDWLVSLSIMFSRVTRVVGCVRVPFFLQADIHCVCLLPFVYPLNPQWAVGCFRLSAVVNKAAADMGVQVSLQDPASCSFEYVPGSGIAGSYGSSVFNLLRN